MTLLTVSELGDFLWNVIRRDYGGIRKRLAEEAGITDSVFNRGLKSGSYEVDTLLRIARAIGHSPSAILRMAGKAHYVPLLEELYGPEAPIRAPGVRDVLRFLERDDAAQAGMRAMLIATAQNELKRMPEPTPESPPDPRVATRHRRGRTDIRPK